MKKTYWLPTRPFSLVDAVNRMAVATGSYRSAVASSGASYNGHRVHLIPPNDFKRYWTAVYTWAGMHTIARGTLRECLVASKRYYDRGDLGAAVIVTVTSEEDAALCEELGFGILTDEIRAAYEATWKDDRYDEVAYALREGQLNVSMLLESANLADYRRKCRENAERRRNR